MNEKIHTILKYNGTIYFLLVVFLTLIYIFHGNENIFLNFFDIKCTIGEVIDPLIGMCLTVSIFSGIQYLKYKNNTDNGKREQYAFVLIMNIFVFIYSVCYIVCIEQMIVVNPDISIDNIVKNVKALLFPTLIFSSMMIIVCFKQNKFK